MKNSNSFNHKRTLFVGAIGVVYGDIGTSPLYALKSCLSIGGLPFNEVNLIGLISLLIWALLFVVSFKYITLVMPVDHDNEGGILVLSARCMLLKIKHLAKPTLLLGILGMSLFFGDCIITPAISVLSAIEGIKLISPSFTPYILPLSIFIITCLFLIQKNGSGQIGKYFGAIMIVWFMVIGVMGLASIIQNPIILKSLNPYYAAHFLATNGHIGFLAVGGVILVLTGAEALYADMGHFGRDSIRICWTYFVFPSLILNYLGQGALLISHPEAISNPFYLMAPSIALYPLVILSTLATVIASQAVISGIFSLSWQGIMLNYLPRMKVIHTSNKHFGQVYVPAINFILFSMTVSMVLLFKTSENLASAYGLSVSGIMLITTFLIFVHAKHEKKWSTFKLSLIFIPLSLLDLSFFLCSLSKLIDGAWCTILITSIVFFVIHTWIKGNNALATKRNKPIKSIEQYLDTHILHKETHIPGSAMFLSRLPDTIPKTLSTLIQLNKFLHEKIFIVSIVTKEISRVPESKRFKIKEIYPNIFQITADFGFNEIPSIQKVTHWAIKNNYILSDEEIFYFMSRSIIIILNERAFLKSIQSRIFQLLCHTSQNGTEFYKIPHDKVIELGLHYKI
ncbi:MAG: KUP/HAK/KT family potassium transporter [Candidatus Paracaedibacteraceae bacterium]|nr:KUP/HAK/KT family potassium transporter [Candidatus Paracaedibacteraceae bacterium]